MFASLQECSNLQALPVRCAPAVHRPIPALIFLKIKVSSERSSLALLVLLVSVSDRDTMLFSLCDPILF